MSKKIRGLRDGTGPYLGGTGRRKRAKGICPFDEDNKENIKTMKLELISEGGVKVVSDEVGKGRLIK